MLNSVFDELEEVKYFKTDFKSLNGVKYFKQIKRLKKSLPKAGTYLEHK